MKECYRVLKSSGRMISITHGKEKNRRFFYRNRFSPFAIEVLPLVNRKANQAQVLIFVLTKGEGKVGGAI
jgi:ubiquinone/menaquinone biosynthesis C-methylase UbiE